MSSGSVVLVRVESVRADNTMRIAPDFPGRTIIVRLLGQESFVRQLMLAHALSVNYQGPEGRFHFILLNEARGADWNGLESALLAHEYGHIWLAALGFRSPVFDDSCLATAVGDIVQHVLIREETARRGFDYAAFWKRTHDLWLAEEEKGNEAPVLDRCRSLLLMIEWTDAEIGFSDEEWPSRPAYLQTLRGRHPDLSVRIDALAAWMRDRNLWDRSVYESALFNVARILS